MGANIHKALYIEAVQVATVAYKASITACLW